MSEKFFKREDFKLSTCKSDCVTACACVQANHKLKPLLQKLSAQRKAIEVIGNALDQYLNPDKDIDLFEPMARDALSEAKKILSESETGDKK